MRPIISTKMENYLCKKWPTNSFCMRWSLLGLPAASGAYWTDVSRSRNVGPSNLVAAKAQEHIGYAGFNLVPKFGFGLG